MDVSSATVPAESSGRSQPTNLLRRSGVSAPPAWWGLIAVLVVTAVVSFLYYHAAWEAPTREWAGNYGDPEQMMWFLAWVPYALLHGHSGLTSNYALYPEGVNLMWNTSILVPGLLLAPITLAAGPVFSYNLLITLTPVATGATAYLLFRRYTQTNTGAVIGGVAFAFCPFLIIQGTGHPQLSVLALVPLLLLLVDELLVRQRWRWWLTGGLLGVCATAQLLTGEEIFVITVLVIVVVIVALAVLHPKQVAPRLRYALSGAAAALAAFVVLAAYPLFVQEFGGQKAPNPHTPGEYVTDLLNFVQPSGQALHLNIVHTPLPFTGDVTEWTGYLGWPLLVLLVWTAIRYWRRQPLVPVATAVVVVFGICTLGPHLHIDGRSLFPLPWTLVQGLPVLKQLLPGRLSMALDLGAAAMIAVFVDGLMQASARAFQVAGVLLVAAVAAFWVPTASLLTTTAQPRFFTSAARRAVPAGSVALAAPYVNGPLAEGTVLWQAESGMRFKMIDGWMIVPGSHFGPTTVASTTLLELETHPVAVSPALRTQFLTYLRANDVHEVIVGPGPGQTRDQRFFNTLFGHRANVRSGSVSLWWVPGG